MNSSENAVNKLFESNERRLLDEYISDVVNSEFKHSRFKNNILKHLNLSSNTAGNSLSHSKRLRGMLCTIISEGLGTVPEQSIKYSAALELVHNASLIIDDIQDLSSTRCNRPALWTEIGKSSAVNHAFALRDVALKLVNNNNEILNSFLSTAVTMAEGQDMDIHAEEYWNNGINAYQDIITKKTGVLLSLACETPAVLGKSSNIEVYRNLGCSLGKVHQLEDDIDDLLPQKSTQAINIDSGSILNFNNSKLSEKEYFNQIIEIRSNWREDLFKTFEEVKSINELKSQAIFNIETIIDALSHRNDSFFEINSNDPTTK